MWSEYVKTFAMKEKIKVVFGGEVKFPCVDIKKRTIYCPNTDDAETQKYFGAIIKHEIAHLLYSTGECKSMIQNAIEDLFVERKLGMKYFGIKQEFSTARNGIYEALVDRASMLDKLPTDANSIALLFSMYFSADRVDVLPLMDKEVQDKFNDNCQRLRRKFFNCENSGDVKSLSEEIRELFGIKKSEDKMPEPMPNAGNGGSSSEEDDDKFDTRIEKAKIKTKINYKESLAPYDYRGSITVREVS